VLYNAEGYGAMSLGGSGGQVVTVSNLNDSGAGSLRAALALEYPRIIVFSVSGTIEQLSRPQISSGRVTIDGSTAPNGGICLKGFGLQVNASDVVIRHLRIRPGANVAPSSNDGLDIMPACRRVVIDHCSLSWAQDENLSIYGQDITISNCIISEGLSQSGHPDGEHSMGAFWLYTANHISFHRNFLTHNVNRNPVVAVGLADVINNILYNGVNPAIAQPQDGNIQLNFIKNWQKAGADSLSPTNQASLRLMQNLSPYTQQAYVEGNISDFRRPNDTYPENAVIYDDELQHLVGSRFVYSGSHPVAETDAVTAKTAVLAAAGATLPKRDSVDARIVADVDVGTGSIIDDPADVGGWPDLTQ
jgi:pectate lyase